MKRTYDNLIDIFFRSGTRHPHIQSFTSTLTANLALRQPWSNSHLFWSNLIGIHSRGSLRDHLRSGPSHRDTRCDIGINLCIARWSDGLRGVRQLARSRKRSGGRNGAGGGRDRRDRRQKRRGLCRLETGDQGGSGNRQSQILASRMHYLQRLPGQSPTGDQWRTHLLPCWERPRFLSSALRVTTVSIFQFVWEMRRTADARVLAGGAAGEGKEEDTARRRPEESLRLIIVGDGGGKQMG